MSRRRIAAALLVVSVAATGCATTPSPEPPAATPEARPGGTLRVGILEPRTLAPWLTSTFDPYGSVIVETMCDSLVELDPRTGEMLPALVQHWKAPNPSQLVAKLRKGLRFSDGTGADAEDVTTSFARVTKSEIGSPVADVLRPIAGWDELRELAPAGQDPKQRDRLAGFRAPEPTSIEVSLAEDAPDFFTVLSHPLGAVVPYDRFREDPIAMERRPICVGPYRLTEPWEPGQRIIRLSRSEAYHARNPAYTRGGRGWADVVEFHVMPDPNALRDAYAQGRVDVAYLADELVPSARESFGSDVVVATTPTVDYLGLPVKSEPWSNVDVRKAISLAIDRRALAQSVSAGVSRPATGFVPDSLGANYAVADARKRTACPDALPAERRLQEAKDMLRSSGVDLAAATMTFTFNDEYENRQLVEAVAAQLRETLGITVELEGQNWETYLASATSTSGLTTPFRLSWAEQYADPSRYLAPLFLRSAFTGDNFSRYSSREFDELIDDALERVNPKDRQAGYLEAENVLCSDLPMVPLLFGGRAYLVRHAVVGSSVELLTHLASGQPLLREMYLKQ